MDLECVAMGRCTEKAGAIDKNRTCIFAFLIPKSEGIRKEPAD